MKAKFILFLLLSLMLTTSGCAGMIASRLADSMQSTMERQSDIDLLYQGLPSLLLLQEAMLNEQTDNATLLLAAARGESGYAEILEVFGEQDRARQHASKGAGYACRLLSSSLALPDACTAQLPFFEAALGQTTAEEVEALFWSATALGTNVRVEQGSPRSLILMPKILAVMKHLLDKAPTFYHGGPHFFLGYYYGSLPVMLGGNSELSRSHFERALEISDRRFLLIQVLYAESYARQTFDRQLFATLLTEVLEANLESNEKLLAANALAKKKAQLLLEQVDQLF